VRSLFAREASPIRAGANAQDYGPLAAVIAAVGYVVADPGLTAELHHIVGDANARPLNLGLKKAVVIDLPADIKEVLVGGPKTIVSSCEQHDEYTSSGRLSVRLMPFSTMPTAGRSLR
jgi:hypothetical protein